MKKIIPSFLLLSMFLAPAACADESDSAALVTVNEKLEEMATTQQQILRQLEEIKTELQVLKVRVSQNQ